MVILIVDYVYCQKEVHGLLAKWNDISNISCTRRMTVPTDGTSPQPTTIIDARIKNIPYKYIVGKKLLFGMNELDITKVKDDPFSEQQFVQRLLQCNYCGEFGHTWRRCKTHNFHRREYINKQKQELLEKKITAQGYNKRVMKFTAPALCRRCGNYHTTKSCPSPSPVCCYCNGPHWTGRYADCPYIKTLRKLFTNSIKLYRAGITKKRIATISNMDILHNINKLLKYLQQQKQLKQQ